MRLHKLPRSYYLRPTLEVARNLLGMVMVRRWRSGILSGRIVETEAYLGNQDPASHAYRGMTRRNDVMFGIGGHLYVYFTYGMHYCCNVVTEEEGVGHAVLIRALEPLEGIRIMTRNRNLMTPAEKTSSASRSTLLQLCSGPGKVCQALGISGEENGTDLCGSSIWIGEDFDQEHRPIVAASTRVGITGGTEHEWRFYVQDNPFVSRGKPAGRKAVPGT
jgi:DNA-3-methyladenine glycosylase